MLNVRDTIPMALLKLRHKAQITLPAELRRRFHLKEGDYLEAEAVENGILLKPVSVVEREKAWREIREAMATVQDTAPDSGQSPQEQEEEIARWVKESHLEHAQRRP
jgi:AbrB family looped-hinge helix DNA binding protein